MKKYKLISFDMFQTLVDVNTQKDAVMHTIFGDEYSVEKADRFWKEANELVFAYFHRLNNRIEDFVTVIEIFQQCYAELFQKHGIKSDPIEGAQALAKAHGKSLFYEDSIPFLEKVGSKYKTCIISDTDEIMIKEILSKVKFDHVFSSEKYQSYKFDSYGKLFKAAFSRFNIQPYEMLHIGDGYSDIAGAKHAGADAAWINRHRVEWGHEIKPDYVVTSLLELSV